MKALATLLILAVGFSAHADLKSTFNKMNTTYKGPFSLNYIQGTAGRVPVRESEVAPGEFQFQSAFRNDMAREVATKDQFYLGNLFTTNYYELMGTYVYNNPYGSFALNHQALLAAAPKATAQMAAMVRGWVLEKHFIAFFPSSKISSAYALRGISGAEFERPYATYFFNLYLSAMNEDFQFLPAFLLAKSSPISDSGSLEKARTLVATLYDSMKIQYGEKDSAVVALYQLRNTIHNQVSPEVVKQIDNYLNNYSRYAGSVRPTLSQIQEILRSYYSVGPKRIAELAKNAGVPEVQAIAEDISRTGFTPANGLALSQAVATLRTYLSDVTIVPYEKKTSVLVLMTSASQYLNKELSALPSVKTNEAIKAVVNLLYIEGFLIKDNWEYFAGEVGATDAKGAIALIPDVVDISNDTLLQAFSPTFDQWLSLEPKMQYFIDNTIKSSALNTASILAKKVN